MKIIRMGVTYQTASMAERERYTFKKDDLKRALTQLKAEKSILEVVILATCNRTEIYVLADQLHTGHYYLKHFLARWFQTDPASIEQLFEVSDAEMAVEHLFLLACGLQSQVVGETQILGQVKKAYQIALEQRTTGLVFNQLFQHAIRYGKKVQHEYALNHNPRSICYQVRQLIEKQPQLEQKQLVIIGLGEMGQLMLQHALATNLGHITVMNRTYAKAAHAMKLASERIIARPWQHLERVIRDADFIVTAVDTIEPILTVSRYQEICDARVQCFFDLGVPRNLDHHMKQIPNKKMYNVDDIHHVLNQYEQELDVKVAMIQQDVWREVSQFFQWQADTGVFSLIQQMRNKQLEHLKLVQQSLERKLPDLTEREQKQVVKHLKSLVNAMLKEPILVTKDIANTPHAADKIALIRQLFGISVERDDEMNREVKTRIRVGTRASKLALAQTKQTIELLQQQYPLIDFTIVPLSTKGDEDKTSLLSKIGGKGIFISNLERALLANEVDMCVHSLKDMPAKLTHQTTLAAILKRENPYDCIVSKTYTTLEEFPLGAKIGTGSIRRLKQLQQIRPDLQFVEIRGNIDTRIEKVEYEQLDGVVLAIAGLKRYGFFDQPQSFHVIDLAPYEIVPAVGQGAIAVQCRADDHERIKLLQAIHHEKTAQCVHAERQLLDCFNANCDFPIGAHAEWNVEGELVLTGFVASKVKEGYLKHRITISNQDGAFAGQQLFNYFKTHDPTHIITHLEE